MQPKLPGASIHIQGHISSSQLMHIMHGINPQNKQEGNMAKYHACKHTQKEKLNAQLNSMDFPTLKAYIICGDLNKTNHIYAGI